LSGSRTTSTTTPSTVHPARQPFRSTNVCSAGSSTIEPAPTPAKAMLIARPRRRANQFGRKSAWPV
jgi:hypothetical protein